MKANMSDNFLGNSFCGKEVVEGYKINGGAECAKVMFLPPVVVERCGAVCHPWRTNIWTVLQK
jgi:hypothetical protein